jgi:hypothetical protein
MVTVGSGADAVAAGERDTVEGGAGERDAEAVVERDAIASEQPAERGGQRVNEAGCGLPAQRMRAIG